MKSVPADGTGYAVDPGAETARMLEENAGSLQS
jgi:hypothetical protein